MYIDITYELNEKLAIYPANPPLSIKKIKNGASTISDIHIGLHTGTHIDAPSHFIEYGCNIDEISLERMNGRAKVICLPDSVEITVDGLKKIDITQDDILLFKTSNTAQYAGNRILDEYVTLNYESAEYLTKKKIRLVGIDYLTIERPRAKRTPERYIHEILLASDVLILEGINMVDVEEGEYELICMPLKISAGDASPVRAVLKTLDKDKEI